MDSCKMYTERALVSRRRRRRRRVCMCAEREAGNYIRDKGVGGWRGRLNAIGCSVPCNWIRFGATTTATNIRRLQ